MPSTLCRAWDGSLGVGVAQGRSESLQIVVRRTRDDVEILGGARKAVHADGDSPDDDELDLRARQREKQVIGLEHRLAHRL
jgi:hypothetical protein